MVFSSITFLLYFFPQLIAGPYAALIIDEKASDAEAALKKIVKR